MQTADQVKLQLQNAGAAKLLMLLLDTGVIGKALDEDEQIQMALQADYDRAPTVIVATNQRLLFFKTTPKQLLKTIPYTELSSAEHQAGGLGMGTITLIVSGQRLMLMKVVDSKRSQAMAEFLQSQAGSDRPLAAPADEVFCPKCGSSQFSANKKGFGLGKAAAGAVLLGPVGLLGGFVGSGKVKVTCIKCGHTWQAGKQ